MADGSTGTKPSVLLVEDEALIAMDLAMVLEDLDLNVAGPFHNASDALAYLSNGRPDVALLDYNLRNGNTSAEVAETLSEQGVPFAFLSGYSATDVIRKAGFENVRCVSKPVSGPDLSRLIDDLRGDI